MDVADLVAGGSRILNSRHLTLSESNFLQGWTPDSKAILFTSNRGGTLALYKQSLSSDEPELIARGTASFRQARVSADGKWVIAFLYPKPGGPTSPEQLVRIPFTGGPPELIFSASPESEISCANPSTNLCAIAEATEDRKRVVVTAFDPVKGRGLQLARFDLDPNQTSIQRGVLVAGIGAWDCCEISPDGTRLAVRQGAEGPIHILSLRGQPAEVIQVKGVNMRGDYNWAADGRGLYVANGVKGGMALLHVDLQGHTHVLLENYGSTLLMEYHRRMDATWRSWI